MVTPAHVADNNPKVLSFLLKGLKGKCYGDKGYLTSLMKELLEKGLHLVTKVRRNMKNMLRRGSIEAVNDILMTVCDIDHIRDRNPLNALAQIFSGLTAYTFLDQTCSFKPARINV
nr:transposase [Pontibacter silvestris]